MSRRFVKISEDNSVLEDRMSRKKPVGDEWIEIPREQMHLLGLEPHKLRWDQNEGLVKKKRIRLSFGSRSFPADGETEVAIGIREENRILCDDNLGDNEEVPVKINGDIYNITKHNDIYLTSDKVGKFIVKVISPYHYATPGELVISAVEPIEDVPGYED